MRLRDFILESSFGLGPNDTISIDDLRKKDPKILNSLTSVLSRVPGNRRGIQDFAYDMKDDGTIIAEPRDDSRDFYRYDPQKKTWDEYDPMAGEE